MAKTVRSGAGGTVLAVMRCASVQEQAIKPLPKRDGVSRVVVIDAKTAASTDGVGDVGGVSVTWPSPNIDTGGECVPGTRKSAMLV
jgi:hypothetical protein